MRIALYACFFFFFFNDTATTEIYTLSLHDALPISHVALCRTVIGLLDIALPEPESATRFTAMADRKSTRLNSSHSQISYAVFCLKKKNSNPLATVIRARGMHSRAPTRMGS